MTLPSDLGSICGCCGAVLPEGRQFTCNDTCEAALNDDINAYLDAARARRHAGGAPEDYMRSREVRGGWGTDLFSLASGITRGFHDPRGNGGLK